MYKVLIVFLISTLSFITSTAQKETTTPNGWHFMDKETSGYYGVSADKAYDFIKSKKLKSKTVVVAVIDSGVDTLHEDLKPILWTNPKEIPGNGIDDDKNGYIDDIHGWNFLGGKDGNNVKEDSYEAARIYYSLQQKYQGKEREDVDPRDINELELWQRAKKQIMGEGDDNNAVDLVFVKRLLGSSLKSDSI